ncbi:hypothetical protein Tco_1087025 [Tanacetum coccineum]
MTKVIKGKFKKTESLKISDDSFACNSSLEIFHKEFNRMCIMDVDLFTYEIKFFGLANVPYDLNGDDDSEQQITHESDDDMEYNPSTIEFTESLALKFFNYKTMDHYTMKALWIYWAMMMKLNSPTKNPLILKMKMKLLNFLKSRLMDLTLRHLCVGPLMSLIIFYKSIQIYLLKILRDLRLTKIIRMIGFTNGTKMCHGYMKNHGRIMEHGRNQLQLRIIMSPSIIKMDVRSGQPVAGRTMDIVMKETYLELT